MDNVTPAPTAPVTGTPADETPVVPDTAAPAEDPKDVAELNKKIAGNIKAQGETAKQLRTQMLVTWKANVDRRLGVPAAQVYTGGLDIDGLASDAQSTINPDWSLTKTKTANLYSQVPTVQLTHVQEAYKAAIPPFCKALNYELSQKRANVGVPMEEVLNDVVNAAGIGGIFTSYVARFEDVPMPVQASITSPVTGQSVATKDMTADQLQRLEAAGLITMTMQPRVVSDEFRMTRISPADLLVPKNFVGSDFNNADWGGFSGRMSWPDAKNELKLKDAQKSQAIGTQTRAVNTLRSTEDTQESLALAETVSYDEYYYWRSRVDSEEKSLKAVWKLVYVDGITDPVVHEPWKGQQYSQDPNERGKFIGCSIFPIQLCTLTYITDNPLPPSDSQAGRPQVDDMRRSRSQMFQNRQRSIPIRWFDVNRIGAELQDNLMHGNVQGMIPTNGDGNRAIGEIARASYPAEDLSFDRQTKQDLMESWQIGDNQMGNVTSGRHTAGEADIAQQNFATRIGQERGRVASFFLRNVEVLAGLMCLYSDFPSLSDQERQAMMQAWNDKLIMHDLVFTIRPDSTVLLDSTQRIDRLAKFLNLTVKSGFVNPKPIIEEMAELSGIDPALVIVDPEPKTEDSNISYRFTSKDDMMNPMVVAMLIHSKQAPSPEEMDAAKKMLEAAQQPIAPPQPTGAPGAPGPAGAVPPGAGGPVSQPQGGHDAHPAWQLSSKVAQRSEDM